MKTAIKNGMVLAWEDDKHQVLNPGDVVFEGGEIVFVGEDCGDEVDEIIDAGGRLVIPGLVNLHTHGTDTAFTKGLLEDHGAMNFTLLYKILPTVRHATDPDAQVAAAECAFAELMLSGSTTVVELGYDYEMMGGEDISIAERVTNVAGRLGVRCYMGPRYRRGYYGLGDDGRVFYRDYPNAGRSRFEKCAKFCQDWDGEFDGRIRTMLAPGQVDTCDLELLEETRRVADETGVSIQIHAGQSPSEYRRICETHHKTTVEYLSGAGLLGPDFMIGHGFWLSEDGNVETMAAHEIAALRDSGTTIVHLAWVKARQGGVLNSFHKYRKHGINVALGTDTYPLDMFNDMRIAAVACKSIEQNPGVATAEEVFYLATVAGANALGRPDLGRLAPGCKADIVLVDIEKPHAIPMQDPFKFLVHGAYASDVDCVIVDGNTVVEGSRVLTMDMPAALDRLKEASRRVWSRLDR